MDQNIQNIILINKSRIAWLTWILTLFLSFLDNLQQDAYIVFQKGVDYFELEHKTCSFLVRDAVPP